MQTRRRPPGWIGYSNEGMNSSKLRITAVVLIVPLAIGAIILALVTSSASGGRRIQRLADGSTLEIRQVIFANGFQYKHQAGNRLLRLIVPILPAFIKNRVPLSSGSFGFGSDGNTNLFVITVNSSRAQGWWSGLRRLVVFDGQGNTHDACWGASTLGMPGEVVYGWQLRAFPRRSKMLGLRFLSQANNRWEVAAEFRIPNPAYGNYSQWTPESMPITKEDGDLVVMLQEFQSGAPFRIEGYGDEHRPETTPRQTRAVFDLRQGGQATTNWTIQKITIADATGNRWSPFLEYGLGSVTNGVLEFAGALWPGENAWKLDVEFVRTSVFAADELWESPPIPIPMVGVVTNLNASFQHDGATVDLVGLAAPQADHPEPFKWIAKYWGDRDKTEIISLAVRISPALDKRRLKLLRAVDQNGREAGLVEHRNEDYAEQAFLLKPDDEATALKLIFALQRSRFVQFQVRPQIVDAEAARRRAQ